MFKFFNTTVCEPSSHNRFSSPISFTIHLMLPYLLGLCHPWFFCTCWVSSSFESLHKELYRFDVSGNVSVALCFVWLYLLCFIAIVLVQRISFHALFLSLVGWDSLWELYSTPLVRLSWFFGLMEVDFISSWRILIISWEDFSSLMSSSRWSFVMQHFVQIFSPL
jgi:hypothetical protein